MIDERSPKGFFLKVFGFGFVSLFLFFVFFVFVLHMTVFVTEFSEEEGVL